ncbi:MAG: hypothetical protein IPI87_12250 [Betaproteobacteria bacterium]|nr:hypothetical protein [Betaproteobacteria bacterium]
MFGALAGVVLFFLVFDPRLVDPGYWIWLMEGDPATQYLGWRFFRAEPWLWPPGMIRSYGLEVGSAIVFTDSIPIAAFAAKLLSPFLPEPFQYFGLWALMCYALQGFFGGMLAALASERPVERYAITLLFVASLPVMDRAIGHFALMSHWLVLWGLWLALRPNRGLSTGPWVALTCIASLVHAYLLYIVLALWVADVLRRRHFDPQPRPSVGGWVRHVTIVSLALVATMALAGYFLLPAHAVTGGAQYYGKYATNLNAFWNPGWGSRFLPGLAVMKGAELEGHAYLGLGMLVLLPIALLTLIAPGSARPNVKPYVPLIAVGILLWMLAVSHLVAWGDRVVLEVPIRGKLLDTIATLRASGRLAWVALYGLWFAAVAIVATRFTPRVATALIVGAVALQLADISPRYVAMRDYFADRFIATPAKRTSPLVSPFWPEAAKHYRTIRMAPVANMARGWEWLSLYAVDHGMAINTGQFARLSFPRVDAANGVITRTLKDGPLDPSTLYLLWSRDAKFDWTIGPDDGVGVFDGYFVVAPGWFAEPRGSIAPEYLVRGPQRGIAP